MSLNNREASIVGEFSSILGLTRTLIGRHQPRGFLHVGCMPLLGCHPEPTPSCSESEITPDHRAFPRRS